MLITFRLPILRAAKKPTPKDGDKELDEGLTMLSNIWCLWGNPVQFKL